MKVVSIDEGYEQAFWKQVNLDPPDYYFFILDWKLRKEQTRIMLAMEGDRVEGALLVYAYYIVQLRGSREAVKQFFDHFNLDKVELQAPLDCENIVLAKYKPHVKDELVLMRLKKGEESVQITEPVVRLGVEDAERVAEIMKKSDPEWWGEVTVENRRDSLQTTFWLGIRRDGKIVSIGNARFVDFASNIGVVATDERYRNRGYATSIVSALVQEILKVSPVALIHVLAVNGPAVRAYSKVGFKPYKRCLSIRGERIKA